jgi:AAA domain
MLLALSTIAAVSSVIELGDWDAVESAAAELGRHSADALACEQASASAQREYSAALLDDDDDAVAASNSRILETRRARRAAVASQTQAHEALRTAVATLGESPEARSGAEREFSALLASVAVDAFDDDFVTSVQLAARSARDRVRALRSARLQSALAALEALVTEAAAIGIAVTATRELVDGKSYLDQPPPEAEQRLNDEIFALRSAIDAELAERTRKNAERAVQSIDALLARNAPIRADTLTALFRGANADPGIASGPEHAARGQRALRLAAASTSFSNEGDRARWIALASALSEGTAGTERLASLVPCLPAPDDFAADDVAVELILATEALDGHPWTVIDRALVDAPRWAEAFYAQLLEDPSETDEARWLLRSDVRAPSNASRIERLATRAEGLPRTALAWWAEARFGGGVVAPGPPLFDLWLNACGKMPEPEMVAREIESAADPRAEPLRMLHVLALLGTRRGPEIKDAAHALGWEAFPRCAEFINALALEGGEAAADLVDVKALRARAEANLDAILDEDPEQTLTTRRSQLHALFLKRVKTADSIKITTPHCRAAWRAFTDAILPRLRQLFPADSDRAEPDWDAEDLRAFADAILRVHAEKADAEGAKFGDRAKMNRLAGELRESVTEVLEAYDDAYAVKNAHGPLQAAWRIEILPLLRSLRKNGTDPNATPEARAAAFARADDLVNIPPSIAKALDPEPIKVRRAIRSKLTRFNEALRSASITGGGSAALADELERMKASGPLGRGVAALVASAVDNPSSPTAQILVRPPPNERDLAALLLGDADRLLHWRFCLASDEAWRAELGADVLEQISGLGGLDVAIDQYLVQRRYDLARDAASACPPALREAALGRVDDAVRTALDDARGLVESFVLEPARVAQGCWPGSEEPEVAAELADVLQDAEGFLARLTESEPSAAFRACDALERRTSNAVAACDATRRAAVVAVRESLLAAVDLAAEGSASPNAAVLCRTFALLVDGRLGAAHRFLEGNARPGDEPASPVPGASAAVPAEPSPMVPPRPKRAPQPVREIDVNKLSTFVKNAIFHDNNMPRGFKPAASVRHASQNERQWTAFQLHRRGDLAWQAWLAHWALEKAYESVAERALREGELQARDAAWLWANQPADDARDFALHEAIVAWLAIALDRNPTALPDDAIRWDALRGDASPATIGRLVRGFFTRSVVDSLAELVADAVEIGGSVASDVLDALDRLGIGPTLRLVRALVEGTPAYSAQPARRTARSIATVLAHPIDSLLADSLAAPIEEWGRAENDQQFLRRLGDAGLPPKPASTLVDAFRARARSRARDTLSPKLTARLLTKRVFLGAEEKRLVIELRYPPEGGVGPLIRDLTLRVSIQHPDVTMASGGKQALVPVAILHRDEVHEHLLPIAAPASSSLAPGEVTIEVYDAYNRRVDVHLTNKHFTLQPGYAAELLNARTPYPTGGLLPKLSMIKGRDDIVQRILKKMEGADVDTPVFVAGARRIGKTTILQKLKLAQAERKRYEAVHVDFMGLAPQESTTCTLLQKIAAEIHKGLESPAARAVPVPAKIPPDDPRQAFGAYLEGVAAALGDRRLLVLFDEFQMLFEAIDKAEADGCRGFSEGVSQEVVNWIRYWVQQARVSFVMAGQQREMKLAISRRASRLYGLGDMVVVGMLEEKAAIELIRVPEKEPPYVYDFLSGQAVRGLLEETGRHPYLLTMFCRDIWERVQDQKRTVVARPDVDEAVKRLQHKAELFDQHLSLAREPIQKAVLWVLAGAATRGESLDVSEVAQQLIVERANEFAREPDVRSALESLYDSLEPDVSIIRREAGDHQEGEGDRFQVQPRAFARHIRTKRFREFVW